MTLKELASVLPGFVTLLIHTSDKSWNIPAGWVTTLPDLQGAVVVQAQPLAAYTMEVSINIKEEN